VPRELIHPPELYDGVPYSYVAVAPGGATVFTAGACPLDADGAVVGGDDVAAQMRQTLDNLVVALRAADCGLEDVVKTTVYVATTPTCSPRGPSWRSASAAAARRARSSG
jgi:enamine deaminase RidA (YjgF/YER057c/UK114 family)